MKVLINGATGNIGSHLLKLVEQNANSAIRAVSRTTHPDTEKLEWVKVDYENKESIKSSLEGIDKVFLIVPFQENRKQLINDYSAALNESEVKQIVLISGGNPTSEGIEIQRINAMMEETIKNTGIAYTFIRPSMFMQNIVNFYADSIKLQGQFYFPFGDAITSYVDARDIAEVAHWSFNNEEAKNQAYTLGSYSHTHNEIAKIASNVIGKEVSYIDVPAETSADGMRQFQMPEWNIEVMQELYAATKAGYLSQSTSTYEDLLGKKPRTWEQFFEDNKTVLQ